ncbi:MAG: hypothetical protein VKK42_20380 [Lyngbya sp.]|nr:hypothetical protein [Lyngbya sp.]
MYSRSNLNWKLKQILSEIEDLALNNEENFSLDSRSSQANLFSSNSAEQLLSYRPRGRRGNPPKRNPGAPHA